MDWTDILAVEDENLRARLDAELLASDAHGSTAALIKKRKKPVALFIDEAHDLKRDTLVGLKRLMEMVRGGDGILSVVLAGHPKLNNELRRPSNEEIGNRATMFSLGAIPKWGYVALVLVCGYVRHLFVVRIAQNAVDFSVFKGVGSQILGDRRLA